MERAAESSEVEGEKGECGVWNERKMNKLRVRCELWKDNAKRVVKEREEWKR